MDCSLFSPIQNLPWYLYPVWPLIFWRIQRLKAWFRRAGGPGSQMLWGVDARPRRVPRERARTMARWMRPLLGRLWTSYGHVRRHIAFAGHLTRPFPPDISILTSKRLHGRRLCWRMAPDPPGAAGRT